MDVVVFKFFNYKRCKCLTLKKKTSLTAPAGCSVLLRRRQEQAGPAPRSPERPRRVRRGLLQGGPGAGGGVGGGRAAEGPVARVALGLELKKERKVLFYYSLKKV